MKKIVHLSVVLIVLVGSLAKADEPVYFTDYNLKSAVEWELEVSDPTSTDMLDLIYLDIESLGIQDLTGLEYATYLRVLWAYDNRISDLSPLSGLTDLYELDLEYNQVSDVSPLSGLTNLLELWLYHNQISDISALSGLTGLRKFGFGANPVSDISVLSNMTNLTELWLVEIDVTDISLSGFADLTDLYIGYNDLQNLSLSGLGSLSGLYTEALMVKNLSFSNLTSLTELDFDGFENMENLSLSGLTGLTELDLANEGLTNVSLSDLPSLMELDLSNNRLTDISTLSGLTNLTHLNLGDNQIADISALAELRSLSYLDLRANVLDTTAYTIIIPQILENNPGVTLLYDMPLTAWNPIPVDGAKVFESTAVLSWAAGSRAASHNVYFGIDKAAVTAGMTGTLMGNQQATTYDPGPLEEGTTYYWRIDEVNDLHLDSPWTGAVWSFTTALGGPIDQPEMGTSLGEIAFYDPDEFAEQVQENNFQHPQNPEYNRLHIERVEGLEPKPDGMMHMQNLEDLDPASSTYSEIVSARAKGAFDECGAGRVLVRFAYLFERSAPGLELVAYLSDVPELPDRDDPLREEHYIEIGRIPMPPAGRPGSLGSGRFGVFEQWVSTGSLDLSNGTWVELELVERQPPLGDLSSLGGGIRLASPDGSGSGAGWIGDWAVEVHCDGICMDLNWSDAPDEEDFMLVLASCGESAGLLEGGVGSRACLDGAFSSDGFVDSFDIASWDWALRDPDRVSRLNMCGVPFSEGGTTAGAAVGSLKGSASLLSLAGLVSPSDLLIVGKRSTSEDPGALKSEDRLYSFESSGQYVEYFDPKSDRCNIKLVKGPEGQLYQINSEEGVSRLDDNEVIIPPGEFELTDINEPRHNKSATVYVGIQDEGADLFGRPVLDAAFDADYAYIVPVVVAPDGNEAYAAAAKLKLLDSGNPPYEVVQLYDDPPPAADNQNRNNLREIEIDSAGNVYVVNVHNLNESDILRKYGPDGTMLKHLELGNPDGANYIPDPIAMHASDSTDMLYLTSAQYNQADVNSTVVYGFSTNEALALKRTITINNMQHVTGITEDPVTGSLWAVGFNMETIPAYPSPVDPAFYYPILAKIPYGGNDAQLTALLGSYDLGFPMSIVWTATADKCGGADLDESGSVDSADFALLASYWLDSTCSPADGCAEADFNKNAEVDFVDLAVMLGYWLEADCDDAEP
ncbi:MAG: leucine-rich repeat domain-containing protein [Phycisphaerales bacterium]|nr:MAG: leucine-rich repeat domain-containing protein [Phycisphaerales bacterium]